MIGDVRIPRGGLIWCVMRNDSVDEAHVPRAHRFEPERWLRGHVPDLNVVFRTDDNGTLTALVAEGLGAAVVPRLVVNPRNPAVVAVPLGSRIPARTLAVAWHRDRYRSAAARAFTELARELGAEYMSRN